MNELGVDVGQNVVIDVSGVGQLFGFGPEVPLVTSYGFHAITERMANLATVYPVVRTVGSADSTPEGITVTDLLTTSENSWAEENLEDLSEGVQPDEGEMTGSLPIGVAVTIELDEDTKAEETESSQEDESDVSEDTDSLPKPEGRVVVVGDSDFIVNNLIQAPIGNRDLFLNMVNWVAEDEDLISVRPREAEDRRVFMSAQQQRNVGYLSLLFIPGIVLLTGISVWWGRR
jgi:ABC-type uncharacterized transport system involved in gliding motility auxiliary subunit